jgi:hypothetical protein
MVTTIDPMRPVPPTTTIFMTCPSFVPGRSWPPVTNSDNPACGSVTGAFHRASFCGLRVIQTCATRPRWMPKLTIAIA